jgi:hypothetical protein
MKVESERNNMVAHPIVLDLIALWFALVGVWPFADPGHSADTALSVFDIALHVAAAWFLVKRWRIKIERREESAR